MLRTRHLFILCLSILGALAQAEDRETQKVLDKVQKTYEKLNDVCADFSQSFYWKLTEETQVVTGHICAKGGDKFKIETPEQLIVTDGKVLWTLNKMNNQVIIDHAENVANDNPFIQNFMQKYISEYDARIVEDQSDNGETCILMTTKSGEHFVPRLWLWIDNKSNLINKIVQQDVNENTTTFEMSTFDMDVKLAANDFKYQIPEGADVIDMR
ncbi:outer membrane lipoprotein carrier protein LolA [candidate division KSB1 bacterium]|nr:outer membrane lipoprotein carrier protein LolA [candidate division KSB1 bacterium]RQW05740.1 MAG: outer membrane lipoprotein carrier protein LolA [candidate division KSB1 bacterium]